MAAGPDINQAAYLLGMITAVILPIILGLAFNCIMGAIAVSMAKKRGLRPVPAFFAGLFLSFPALFIVALTPKSSGEY